jgi:hypothetical protein
MIYIEEVKIKIDPMRYLTVASWLEGYAKGILDKKTHERLINNLNAGSELLRAVWLASEEAKGEVKAINKRGGTNDNAT